MNIRQFLDLFGGRTARHTDAVNHTVVGEDASLPFISQVGKHSWKTETEELHERFFDFDDGLLFFTVFRSMEYDFSRALLKSKVTLRKPSPAADGELLRLAPGLEGAKFDFLIHDALVVIIIVVLFCYYMFYFHGRSRIDPQNARAIRRNRVHATFSIDGPTTPFIPPFVHVFRKVTTNLRHFTCFTIDP